MSWDNISRSLGSVIDERLSNPLVTTFAISWSIINWKFFVVLFSDNSATTTVALVRQICYPNWNEFWGWAVAAPIAATLAYTYLLPFVSNPFLRDWRTNQQKVNGIKDTLPIEAVLTLKESLEIRKQQTELENTNNTLRTDAQGLRTQLFAAQDKIVELENIKMSMENVKQESSNIRALLATSESELTKVRARCSELEAALDAAKSGQNNLRESISHANNGLTHVKEKAGEVFMQAGAREASGFKSLNERLQSTLSSIKNIPSATTIDLDKIVEEFRRQKERELDDMRKRVEEIVDSAKFRQDVDKKKYVPNQIPMVPSPPQRPRKG
ncbi:MAG: hypothetical protein C4535_10910 [Comamonadaceae bacterium]|nr:MAG: hypothetical protein C4535_10910 [Comamonadaceae bacterium]